MEDQKLDTSMWFPGCAGAGTATPIVLLNCSTVCASGKEKPTPPELRE